METASIWFRPSDWWLALACASAAPLVAQTPSLTVPVTGETLSNGLTVIVHEGQSVPIAAVNIWYHISSMADLSAASLDDVKDFFRPVPFATVLATWPVKLLLQHGTESMMIPSSRSSPAGRPDRWVGSSPIMRGRTARRSRRHPPPAAAAR